MYRFVLPNFKIKKSFSYLFFRGSLGVWFCLPTSICLLLSGKVLGLVRPENFSFFFFQKALIRACYSSLSPSLKCVSLAYSKALTLKGVGYRFSISGEKLTLFLGYSLPIEMEVSPSLKLESLSRTSFKVWGANPAFVNNFIFRLRKLRFPDRYKGKGVLFSNEVIFLKLPKKT